jgi:hypothetical protein
MGGSGHCGCAWFTVSAAQKEIQSFYGRDKGKARVRKPHKTRCFALRELIADIIRILK